MSSPVTSVILLVALVAVVLVGRNARRRLPEEHLSADSKDTVKLALGLVATMTALLLGLLVSSAKGTFDTQRSEVIQIAAKVTFLDRVLSAYGPEAADARAYLRDGVGQAIRRIWPDEPNVPVQLRPKTQTGDAIFVAIQQLSPRDEAQRALKSQAATLVVDIGMLRALLLAQTVSSIPKPLLISVFCWLLIIFGGFTLLAPRNATATLSLIAAAVSVAGAVFLILELDQPLQGLIRIPAEPLVNALHDSAQGDR